MSAPERVWQCWVGYNSIGWVECASDHPNAVPFVPESRALAAEQERDDLQRHLDRLSRGLDPMTGEPKEHQHKELAALRAERDALVPLARFGLWAHEESQSAGGLWEDEAKAKSFELGLHIGFGRDSDVTIAARAVLAKEGT